MEGQAFGEVGSWPTDMPKVRLAATAINAPVAIFKSTG